VAEQEGRDGFAAQPLGRRLRQAVGEDAVVQRRIELLRDGKGVGDHQAAAGVVQGPVVAHRLRDLIGRIDLPIERKARVVEVEARELARAIAEHRHVQRLEPLERRADIQDRFAPRAHHGHGLAAERHKIGALIEA